MSVSMTETECIVNPSDIKDIEDLVKFDDKSLELEDEKEVAPNSGSVYGFEDLFEEVEDSNPYYRKAQKISDDDLVDPSEIPIPYSLKDASPKKIEDLKKYVSLILEELERISDKSLPLDASIEDHKQDHKQNYKHNLKLYDQARQTASRKFSVNYKKPEIYYAYRLICRDLNIEPNSSRIGMMQTKPYRSESGVMVFAIFTHPMWRETQTGEMKAFSCAYDCWYCPQQPGRPRSYVDGEPGNDRAVSVNYDTKKQVYVRGSTYIMNGHPIDKAEVIILGGTFHSYAEEYIVEFFRNMYYSFNTINGERGRSMLSLEDEMRLNTCMDSNLLNLYAPNNLDSISNRNSICRVIGLTIETRPDQINSESLIKLRKYGVTRVQLGVQHIDNRILLRVNRGCTNEDTIQAILNLKRNGFKVDIHLMPDLPKPFTEEFEKSNKSRIKKIEITSDDVDWDFNMIEADRRMFREVFHGEDYCPDQVKIYPFEVMDWTRLKDEFDRGLHISYAPKKGDPHPEQNELIRLLIDVSKDMPRYVRVNRLKRDIPSSYNMGGLTDSHGGSFIHHLMEIEGSKCGCIRCNEIKKQKIDIDTVRLEIIKYRASDGDEYFIYYTDDFDHVIGFIRLRLDSKAGYFTRFKRGTTVVRSENLIFPELQNCAMIRELHVYGEAVRVSSGKNNRTQQHAGFGTRLVYAAFLIAYHNGYRKMSVIPGEGVKQYYFKKFDFVEEAHFMTLNISDLPRKILDNQITELVEISQDPRIMKYFFENKTKNESKNEIDYDPNLDPNFDPNLDPNLDSKIPIKKSFEIVKNCSIM